MAHGPSKSRKTSHERSPVNMVPIMNLFIVIIPMLINMWVAYQVAMLYIDVSSGAGSETPKDQVKNDYVQNESIKIGLFKDHIEIQILDADGKQVDLQKIPALVEGGITIYPYEELHKRLADIRALHQEKNPDGKFVYDTIGISPNPQITYDTLLRAMDICKMNFFKNIKYLPSQLVGFGA
jgi:hypothetical protein